MIKDDQAGVITTSLDPMNLSREEIHIAARHPHWTGILCFNEIQGRARLIANNAHASYSAIKGGILLLWDNFPAEWFIFINGNLVHASLVSVLSHGLEDRPREIALVKAPSTNFAAALRWPGSDCAVFQQVFQKNEYETPLLPKIATTIIDLGANTGLASLYFAQRYPAANVYAVEPDIENYQMLVHNIEQAGDRCIAIRAAIWADDRDLNIKSVDDAGRPLGDWGIQVLDQGCGDGITVSGWSMGRLISNFEIAHIDILKIDIEGAEKELFEANDLSWLDIVDLILIETHERFKPGCDAAVRRLEDFGFAAMQQSGENLVFAKKTVRTRQNIEIAKSRRSVMITPYFQEDAATIRRCIESVIAQGQGTEHILVADGHPQSWINELPVRHLKLDRSHGDYGNTPRGLGALLAISEGYDAIGFLDADNWLEPNHVQSCYAAIDDNPEVDFVVARWNLRRPDGSIIQLASEAGHVDTNCFFLLPGSYHISPHFSMMPKELSPIGDRIFFAAIKAASLTSVEVSCPTVNYSCMWASVYRAIGEEPPLGAKSNIDSAEISSWLRKITPRALEIVERRAGIKFA